ncbi:hypothetical protein [Metabacillus idriensis]|uniref:hypothetical protein n=1 Tax=Metabacillus idriensis TaxID=324768 RepID=UPI00174DC55F|nr:hypothetical protein [Metabacillus idriensis]
MLKRYKRRDVMVVMLIIGIPIYFVYNYLGQDRETAKEFANELYTYPLPPKTKIIDKSFVYGVGYGGGTWGSGGRVTHIQK